MPIAVALVAKQIVDLIVESRTAANGPIQVSLLNQLAIWVALEFLLVSLIAIVNQMLPLVRLKLGAALTQNINKAILEKALVFDACQFEDPRIYDLLTRAKRDSTIRPQLLLDRALAALKAFITFFAYIAILSHFSVGAVVAIVMVAVPSVLIEISLSRQGFALQKELVPDRRMMAYFENLILNDVSFKEIRFFNIGPKLMLRHQALGESTVDKEIRFAVRKTRAAYVLAFIGTVAQYIYYGYLVYLTASSKITLGEMTLYSAAIIQSRGAVQLLFSSVSGVYEDNLYMSTLYELLDVRNIESSIPRGALPSSAPSSIKFENVSFRYPGSEKWVLRNISFTIEPNERVVIVGENGAGKSTLLKLLLGFYAPSEGRVLVGGEDIRQWSHTELHARMTLLCQDFNRYQLPLKDNVGFGSTSADVSEDDIVSALNLAGVDISDPSLPFGLDTQLGRWFEKGVEISTGQWQKIALARAFIRPRAGIVILDEPTSAFDPKSEHAFLENMAVLLREKTSVTISHRMALARQASQVIVIEDGMISDKGTHHNLLERNAKYAELYRLQQNSLI